MNKSILLFLLSALVISGCGGPLGKWELRRDTVAEVNTGANRQYETVTRNGVQYQIERSGAHPAISWAVGPNRLGALINNVADQIDYRTIDTMQGNRYTFLKECDGETTIFDPTINATKYPVKFRVFEYTDKDTLYILRAEDMSGKKFGTFIVVASWLKPTGNYSHWIEQRTNKREEVRYCQ